MCGIYKNGKNEPICRAEIETDTQRTNVWTLRGKKQGGMNWEIGTDIHIYTTVYKIEN